MSDQKELDLVFLCDCTGSMGSYIAAAKQNIQKIVEDVVMMEKCDVRFALVGYRDHPPQDQTYVTQIHPFTTSVGKMREYVNTLSAQGGGDGPEAVTDSLQAALTMDWRKNAAKVACLIADAPPHGLGENGDGFPNGCPCNIDPIEVAKSMAEMGIVIYSIGVEPTLSSSYKFARDFMMSIARITEGQFLPLSSANLLAKVIVGGAIEELSLNTLMKEMEEEVKRVKEETKGAVPEEEIVKKVTERMQTKDIKTNQLKVDNLYAAPLDETYVNMMTSATSLKTVLPSLQKANPGAAPSSSYGAMPRSSMAPPSAYPPPAPPGGYGGVPPPPPSAAYGAMPSPSAYGAPPPPPSAAYGAMPSPSPAYGAMPPPSAPAYASMPAQTASYEKASISHTQVEKMYNRAKKQNKFS